MLHVRLLGVLEVGAGAAGARVPAGRPARLLLGWLAAFPGAHARGEVAARLWPDVLDESARASLRTALSDCVRRSAPRACTSGRRARRSNSAATACGSTCARSPSLSRGRLEEALSLCRGEVLEGLDAEWVLDLRSRHAAERADAAVALIRAARQAGGRGVGAGLGAPSRRVGSAGRDRAARADARLR